MSPKEKAQELVQKYIDEAYKEYDYGLYVPIVKSCALIAVDEILSALQIDAGNWIKYSETKKYWEQVKQEIKAL